MSYELHHADFKDILTEPDSVDAIITDPPYPRQYAYKLTELVDVAASVLVPGGHLVVLIGQLLLPNLMAEIARVGLRYRWTFSFGLSKASAQMGPRVLNAWKPIVWASKGQVTQRPMLPTDTMVTDAIRCVGGKPQGKGLDNWGQGQDWASYMLDIASVSTGHVVCDPMMGLGYIVRAAHERGAHGIGIDYQEELVTKASDWLGGMQG